MGKSKTFYFDFYQCETISSQENRSLLSASDIFQILKDKFDSRREEIVRTINGILLDLRDIEEMDYGYRGIAAKHRQSDLPHAAIPGGHERELSLEDNEHLIEKIYFNYYHDYKLLIIQRNSYALGFQLFSQYLSINGYTTALHPILKAADIQRLMRGEVNLRNVKLIIARPTNPSLFYNLKHDFNNSIIASLKGSNSASVNLEFRGDGHSRAPKERYLDPSIKRALIELTSCFNVKKAAVSLEENGITHPIDLVADRLFYLKKIKMNGRYPLAAEMWTALREARDKKEQELENYFGALENENII
jgi:hypothetical protein